jgi:uncharacterized protein with LGFP repeats
MKKTFQIAFAILVSIGNVYAQKGAVGQEKINKIMVKANKYGLKPANTSNQLVRADFANGNYVEWLSFNNFTASVYVKEGYSEAYAVWGEILKYYDDVLVFSKKQKNILGAPTTDEFKTPNKNGAGQHFEGGSIYWSASTGAHEVHGAIKDKWASMGWENSYLGFPVSDETATPDGYGRFNFFEGGAIYYHPNLGTFAVNKQIAEIWKKEGWERGKLGYPTSDEIIKNNNSVQFFEFGAVVSTHASPYMVIYNYYKNAHGLYTKWKEIGNIDATIGGLVIPNKNYPRPHDLYFAEFERGYIYESVVAVPNSSIGKQDAFVIKKGPIFNYYASKNWEQGYLGLPISDEMPSENFTIQKFQGGTIYYSSSTGAFEKR